jgi:hypothetical protein
VLTSRGFVAGRGHREIAEAAIAGSATAVQLRAPELGDGTLTELAPSCRSVPGRGVLFAE